MLRLERNFEGEKQRFLGEHEYTVPELFSLFSDSTAAKLSSDEVMLGLKVFGMIQRVDAELLVQRYDSDEDGKLSYWELSNLFLPVGQEARNAVLERKSSKQDGLSKEGTDLVREFLNQAVNLEHIHKIRRETEFTQFKPSLLFA